MDQRTEELQRDSRVADRIDKERAELFAVMVKTPAWASYLEVLNSMIEQRGAEILSPANSVDGAIALEHVKGTMYGLILARDLPSITISQMAANSSVGELLDADSQ